MCIIFKTTFNVNERELFRHNNEIKKEGKCDFEKVRVKYFKLYLQTMIRRVIKKKYSTKYDLLMELHFETFRNKKF